MMLSLWLNIFFYSFTTEEAMLERKGSPGKVTQGPINEKK